MMRTKNYYTHTWECADPCDVTELSRFACRRSPAALDKINETHARTEAVCHLSAEEIRSVLASKGVKGKRNDSKCCALAQYYKQNSVSCNIAENTILIRGPESEDWQYDVGLDGFSPGLIEFIKRFDDGEYPELEE